jgi:hypothetical protein
LTEIDLGRIDFIGINAPSAFFHGYPSYGQRPIGWGAISAFDRLTGPDILSGRPLRITVGPPQSLQEPTWSSMIQGVSDPPAGVIHDLDGELRVYEFSYDSNKSEVTSFTDFRQVRTTFSFSTQRIYGDESGKGQSDHLHSPRVDLMDLGL